MKVEDVLDDPKTQEMFLQLSTEDRAAWLWWMDWHENKAMKYQVEPSGDWWSIWMMLAGRGAGKTRTAAETIGQWAWENPNTRWLVAAPTSSDVRGTCFEGESGLLAVIPKELVEPDGYNKSLHELYLKNGSLIKGISASEPDRFRGAQWHGAWCDELAAWDYLQESWDMIMFSVRLGKRTKVIVTTTPKPKPLIMDLVGREGDDVVITRASTYSNIKNLAPSFQKQILQYEGTNLGLSLIHI